MGLSADVVEWRGPAPHVFAVVPADLYGEIHFAARTASYGWGCVPVEARIGSTDFTTALIPRGDHYMLPVKLAVRRVENVAPGDRLEVTMKVVPPKV